MRRFVILLSFIAPIAIVVFRPTCKAGSGDKPLFVYTRATVSRGDAQDEALSQMLESGAVVERVKDKKKEVVLYQNAELKIASGRVFPPTPDRKVLTCPLRVDRSDGLLLSFDLDGVPLGTYSPYYPPFIEMMFRSPSPTPRERLDAVRVISIPTAVHSQLFDCRWAIQEKRLEGALKLSGPISGVSRNGEIAIGGFLERQLGENGRLMSAKNSLAISVNKERFLRDMPENPDAGEIRRLLANSKVVVTLDETQIRAAGSAARKDLPLSEPIKQVLQRLKQ